jgi:POT family proton-dependent oligopeptide transporter
MTSTAPAEAAARRDRAFLGHPVGLGWLTLSEVWERFSYYGMQALLVLYMTSALFKPGHIGHVWGFAAFRRVLEVSGPMTPLALASTIFGLYTGLVYLTPILGGLIADRITGRTRAVTAGAILMACGHFLMAFDQSFLIALICLLLGTGLFKGNISSQVGDLYGEDDPRRADAFQIFLFAIQIAGIVTPLVCGTLGEVYGWHWGFGAAGVGMLIGLAAYLAGRPSFPPDPKAADRARAAVAAPPLTRGDWRTILVLAGLVPILAMGGVGNQQGFNLYLIWAKASYQLDVFGLTMPVTWLLSIGGVIAAATIALSVAFWRWWGSRWAEPTELTKLILGTALGVGGQLILAGAAMTMAVTGHRVDLGWAMGFAVVNCLGFANVTPIGLALFSRAAPKGTASSVIGLYFLNYLGSNLAVGWLGGLYEKMTPTDFWLMHAGIMGAATVLLIAVKLTVGRSLAPAYAAPKAEAPDAATVRA